MLHHFEKNKYDVIHCLDQTEADFAWKWVWYPLSEQNRIGSCDCFRLVIVNALRHFHLSFIITRYSGRRWWSCHMCCVQVVWRWCLWCSIVQQYRACHWCKRCHIHTIVQDTNWEYIDTTRRRRGMASRPLIVLFDPIWSNSKFELRYKRVKSNTFMMEFHNGRMLVDVPHCSRCLCM